MLAQEGGQRLTGAEGDHDQDGGGRNELNSYWYLPADPSLLSRVCPAHTRSPKVAESNNTVHDSRLLGQLEQGQRMPYGRLTKKPRRLAGEISARYVLTAASTFSVSAEARADQSAQVTHYTNGEICHHATAIEHLPRP